MRDKDKERQIVKMLSEGRKATEIGLKLELSNRTVEKHIEEIKNVYEAENTPHLVAIFLRRKIIR